MRVTIVTCVALVVMCLSSCTRSYRKVEFNYDSDVLCLGMDRTVYPAENADGEIPDSAWDGFRFQQEFYLVNPENGASLSDASFAYVSDFHDGVAVARDNSGACFFIDKSGRRVIDALYKDATLFSDGRAWVRSFDDEIIAVDRKGNKVFYAPEAVMVNTFYDGKAVIYTQDGHTKVVDTSGKELFDGKGHGGNFVVDGRIVMPGADGQGVMSLDGDFILAPVYKSVGQLQWVDIGSYVDALCDDRFIVLKDSGYGVVDKTGKEIVPAVFEDIVRDGEMFLAQSRGGGSAVGSKAIWYNRDGKVEVEGAFTEAYPFGNGNFAAACDSQHWGFIDKKGNWAIKPAWTFVGTSMDANGRAVVYDNDSAEAGLLRADGTMAVEYGYSVISPLKGTGLYVISNGQKTGIMDMNGEIVVPADKYDFSGVINEDRHLYIYID